MTIYLALDSALGSLGWLGWAFPLDSAQHPRAVSSAVVWLCRPWAGSPTSGASSGTPWLGPQVCVGSRRPARPAQSGSVMESGLPREWMEVCRHLRPQIRYTATLFGQSKSRSSLDSRGRETDFSSRWVVPETHITKSKDKGRSENCGYFCHRPQVRNSSSLLGH